MPNRKELGISLYLVDIGGVPSVGRTISTPSTIDTYWYIKGMRGVAPLDIWGGEGGGGLAPPDIQGGGGIIPLI